MSRIGWLAGAFMLMAASVASASPWAEVGDAQLRSDIQILATAGVIDDITTHWPIPWAGIVSDLRREDVLSGQPAYIREAARRVLKKAGQRAARHNIIPMMFLGIDTRVANEHRRGVSR